MYSHLLLLHNHLQKKYGTIIDIHNAPINIFFFILSHFFGNYYTSKILSCFFNYKPLLIYIFTPVKFSSPCPYAYINKHNKNDLCLSLHHLLVYRIIIKWSYQYLILHPLYLLLPGLYRPFCKSNDTQ